MRNLSFATLVLSSMFMLLLAACGNNNQDEAQDDAADASQKKTEVAPEVIFENDYAKIAHIKLAPGESTHSHEGGNRVIYSLTNYSIDWEENGEKLGTKTWKEGESHFHGAGKHSAKNSGTTSAEWLVFAKKNTALPDCADNTVENDVNSAAPEFAQMVFENEEFRVTRVTLPAGKSIPKHSGINRVLYSLSDYSIDYESDKEGKVAKQFKAGDVHWHEACLHSVENIGDTDAEFLVVSYKEKG